MKKYDGHAGIVEKFGKKWYWVRQVRHDPVTNAQIEFFKVEPHYEVDLQTPRWRPGEEGNLTLTITVRGAPYTFPARRMPCRGCDGGIRFQLGLHVHGGVCYCDKIDYTFLDLDHDKMNEEQKEAVAMYHLDLQVSSYF